MPAFHETLFPLDIALKSAGGPERKTDIVTLGSGREQRNARWADSRRRYDAGYGIKTLAALRAVVAFFEERRGQLHGFRWRDRLDHASAATITPFDQPLGIGNGATAAFQLGKTYGVGFAPYRRVIAKPVAGSVRVAVNGVESSAAHFSCDTTTGIVTFAAGRIPAPGTVVTLKAVAAFTASGLDGFDEGLFTAGRLQWSGGANAALAMEIKEHRVVDGVAHLTLWQAMAEPIAPGDAFTLTAGCDKSFTTCRGRFGNAVNFRGFPQIPGNDFLLASPTSGRGESLGLIGGG